MIVAEQAENCGYAHNREDLARNFAVVRITAANRAVRTPLCA